MRAIPATAAARIDTERADCRARDRDAASKVSPAVTCGQWGSRKHPAFD